MIFYFSATGNSLYTAQVLQEGLGETICSMTLNPPPEITRGERIGFVFPVYWFGVPNFVAEFLNRLKLEHPAEHPVFAVITCGGSIGRTGAQFEALLKQQGFLHISLFSIALPDNYVLVYNPPKEAEQQELFRQADRLLPEIIEIIQQGKSGDYCKHKGAMPGLVSGVMQPIYRHGRKTRKFHAQRHCIMCGLCERICPVNAIKLKGGIPTWTTPQCEHCLACIHRCPVAAIQFGNGTKKRNRYVNPNAVFPKL